MIQAWKVFQLCPTRSLSWKRFLLISVKSFKKRLTRMLQRCRRHLSHTRKCWRFMTTDYISLKISPLSGQMIITDTSGDSVIPLHSQDLAEVASITICHTGEGHMTISGWAV